MVEEGIQFLADESCDFAVVRSLRSAGYDVVAVTESFPSATDKEVIGLAVEEDRILITEDRDFGEWVFAHKEQMRGVLYIRFPGHARSRLAETVVLFIEKHARALVGNFTVLQPGRARIRQYRE